MYYKSKMNRWTKIQTKWYANQILIPLELTEIYLYSVGCHMEGKGHSLIARSSGQVWVLWRTSHQVPVVLACWWFVWWFWSQSVKIPWLSRPGVQIIKFHDFPGFPGPVQTLLYIQKIIIILNQQTFCPGTIGPHNQPLSFGLFWDDWISTISITPHKQTLRRLKDGNLTNGTFAVVFIIQVLLVGSVA